MLIPHRNVICAIPWTGKTGPISKRFADLNYATVNSLWTDEVRDVQVVTLEKIARVLGVKASDLYTPVDDDEE